MNSDEESNYQIAINRLQGKGYTINGEATAFHGTFPVFVYMLLMKHNISKETWIGFIHYVSIILFLLSIVAFYRISKTSGINEKLTVCATLVYAFYPSNIFYIGNLFLYEKIALPLLVIVFYFFIRIVHYNSKYPVSLVFLLSLVITISCLFRAQLIFIYFGLFAIGGGVYLFKLQKKTNRLTLFSFYSMTGILMIGMHVPILMKNKSMFGVHMLSTQPGFELMQGHNKLARGSWYGNWHNSNSEYYKHSHKVIPNLNNLNEYQESEKRKEIALSWIKENPKEELVLNVRKLAIFFLPKNYEAGYNVINFVIHLAFFTAIAMIVFSSRRKVKSGNLLLLFLSPIVLDLLLCFIFFVGFRWRYYAEPFLILTSAYVFSSYVRSSSVQLSKVLEGKH